MPLSARRMPEMSGTVDWSILIFVVTVFSGGATLAWFFSSTISRQSTTLTESFEKKIDETKASLEKKIEGLDIVAKSDRISITSKIDALDERDRNEHKEMRDLISEVRVDLAKIAKPSRKRT